MNLSSGIQDSIGLNKVYLLQRAVFLFILIAYFVLGIFLLDIFRYHINTDVPTYVAIAHKYAAGHFHDAINSFWSPLISWLMVPLILFGMDPLVAFKVVGLVTGIFGFFVLKGLLLDFSIPESDIPVLLLGLIPAFYAFTLITMNPDFLLAVILLFYVRLVISENYGKKITDGLVCGFLGVVAYFAKGFAFPFFITHFIIINLCRYFSTVEATVRKNILSCLIIGLVTFAFLSSPWIYLISAKFGKLTFNNAGSYNFKLVMDHGRNPMEYIGFTAPPDPISVSIFDSPDILSAVSHLGGQESIDIAQSIAIVGHNIIHTVDIYQAGSIFSTTIIIFSVLFLMGLSKREVLGNKVSLALVTIVLYTAGYLPILVNKRYFYLSIFLIFVLGVSLIYRHDFLVRGRKNVALVCLCISFMFMPIRDLYANVSVGRDIYRFSKVLGDMGVSGRIASNGSLDGSLFASYHLRAKYYGIASPGLSNSSLLRELNRYRINYYFCWQGKPCHGLLSQYPEISGGTLDHLRIYKLADTLR